MRFGLELWGKIIYVMNYYSKDYGLEFSVNIHVYEF